MSSQLVQHSTNLAGIKLGVHAFEKHHNIAPTQRLVELISQLGSLHSTYNRCTTTSNGCWTEQPDLFHFLGKLVGEFKYLRLQIISILRSQVTKIVTGNQSNHERLATPVCPR